MNKTMKRNQKRFLEDFCFQLSKEEYGDSKIQIGSSSEEEHDGTTGYYIGASIKDEGAGPVESLTIRDARKRIEPMATLLSKQDKA